MNDKQDKKIMLTSYILIIISLVFFLIVLINYLKYIRSCNSFYDAHKVKMNSKNDIKFNITNELKSSVVSKDIKTSKPFSIESNLITEDINSEKSDNKITSNDDFNLSIDDGSIKIDTTA